MHKLCLPIQNTPLGSIALNTALASNLSDVIVIANETPWLLRSLRMDRLHILSCKNAFLGQSYSLRCGVEKAESMNADGVVVMLADQPFITTRLLNEIINCYRINQELHYAAAGYQGIPRPPVLFSKKLFPVLKELKGDKGARSIFSASLFQGKIIPYDNADLFYDVDTWVDYDAVKERWT